MGDSTPSKERQTDQHAFGGFRRRPGASGTKLSAIRKLRKQQLHSVETKITIIFDQGKEGRERQSQVLHRLKEMEHSSENRAKVVAREIAELREEGRLERQRRRQLQQVRQGGVLGMHACKPGAIVESGGGEAVVREGPRVAPLVACSGKESGISKALYILSGFAYAGARRELSSSSSHVSCLAGFCPTGHKH